jgi:hypothetical protein
MRITPYINDDEYKISMTPRSAELPPLDKSFEVISRPLEILQDEKASPIISSISSPITTVAKPNQDNGNKEDTSLQTQMKSFFEGDDSWEDVGTLNVHKSDGFGFL